MRSPRPVVAAQFSERVQRELAETQLQELLRTTGLIAKNIDDFASQLPALRTRELADSGIAPETVQRIISSTRFNLTDELSNFEPTLGDIDLLSPEAQAQAIAAASRRFEQATGNTPQQVLPQQGQRVAERGFTLAGLESVFGPEGLGRLLTPLQDNLSRAADGIIGTTFDKVVAELKRIGSRPTYQINVKADNRSTSASGEGAGNFDLPSILRKAKDIASPN